MGRSAVVLSSSPRTAPELGHLTIHATTIIYTVTINFNLTNYNSDATNAIALSFFRFGSRTTSRFGSVITSFRGRGPAVGIGVGGSTGTRASLHAHFIGGHIPSIVAFGNSVDFNGFTTSNIFCSFASRPVISALGPNVIRVTGGLIRAASSSGGHLCNLPFTNGTSNCVCGGTLFHGINLSPRGPPAA